jgi:hypothetical protein
MEVMFIVGMVFCVWAMVSFTRSAEPTVYIVVHNPQPQAPPSPDPSGMGSFVVLMVFIVAVIWFAV